MGQGPTGRPKPVAFGTPWCPGAWPVRGHRPGARPVHAAWRRAQRRGGAPSMMRFTTYPTPWLKLHAATSTPRWRRPERGHHWSSGRFNSGARRRSGQVASWWTKTCRLGFLAAWALHKHEKHEEEAHQRREAKGRALTDDGQASFV
jgi:hypothetical protein